MPKNDNNPKAPPHRGSVEEHVAALRNLKHALERFLDTGWKSEGSSDPHPLAGMDPDELDCDSVNSGGEIHNAVCALEPFYGGRLSISLSFPRSKRCPVTAARL